MVQRGSMVKLSLVGLLLFGGTLFAKPAPTFSLPTMSGKTVSLSDYLKKDRGVLLCFWASWCTPCLEELKSITDELKARKNLPLDVVTINVDTQETSVDVSPTVRLYKIPFPVLLDPTHEIFSRYRGAEKTLPFSVFVDSDGEWKESYQGYQASLFSELEALLKKPLKK